LWVRRASFFCDKRIDDTRSSAHDTILLTKSKRVTTLGDIGNASLPFEASLCVYIQAWSPDMMQLRDAVFKLAFLVLFLCTQGSRSFVIPRHHRPDAPPIFVTREEYFRPHFQVASEVPVDMGRMIQCAESDACSVSEMEEMVHGM
jgi:hypothetical protein